MSFFTIEKKNFPPFLDNLIKAMDVVGVKEKIPGKFEYAPLEDSSELCLDYDVTILPPKKYLLPTRESLVKFTRGENTGCEAVFDGKPLAIVGVHPYDIKAISQLDRIFADQNPDEHYAKRRKDKIIIGSDVKRPYRFAFCGSMKSALVEYGYDLLLTDIGDRYVLAVGTKKGAELLSAHAEYRAATEEEISRRSAIRKSIVASYNENTVLAAYEELPELLAGEAGKGLFDELAEKCLSCGSCNLVCPTCYCFDVLDEVSLNLAEGERFRKWDGCLLDGFALVATGENFREDRADRIKHRLSRKGRYIYEKYGEHGCVGCGRCASACLPDIANPVEIFNRLKEGVR